MEPHEMEERRWRLEEERENGLFHAGARSERIRLRPLLERSEAFLLALERYHPTVGGRELKALVADLRIELRKNKKPE